MLPRSDRLRKRRRRSTFGSSAADQSKACQSWNNAPIEIEHLNQMIVSHHIIKAERTEMLSLFTLEPPHHRRLRRRLRQSDAITATKSALSRHCVIREFTFSDGLDYRRLSRQIDRNCFRKSYGGTVFELCLSAGVTSSKQLVKCWRDATP
jgi:hypothetical protein